MLTLVNKVEMSITPQYLTERGITIAGLFNPKQMKENLHRLLSQVPNEYLPKQPVVLQSRQDGVNISYELERIPVVNSNDENFNSSLDISGEAEVEVVLDNAVFTVSDSRFCKKQTLTLVDTPVEFVQDYLEHQDCTFHIRRISSHVFEVTIMPVFD